MSDATDPPNLGPQDAGPPSLALIVAAALNLRPILEDPGRSSIDKRRAVDALGRALLRLKRSL